MKTALGIIGLCLIAVSCASEPVVTGAESEGERMYRMGLAYLERGDYEEAQKQFLKVISDFSYSKWEPYARIGLADTHFQREEFSAAFEVYKLFLQMRPSHEKADWAAFQMANCAFEQRPSDFWLLPPPEEKDLSESVERAADLYRDYLAKYPHGAFVTEAHKKLAEAESLLIARDLAVARFYAKKGRCPGVRMRLEHIAARYTVTSDKMKQEIADLERRCPPAE